MRFSYVDPINPSRSPQFQFANENSNNRGLGVTWVAFTPNEIEGLKKNSTWQHESRYGGHILTLNDDHDAEVEGYKTLDSKVSGVGQHCRNEYNIYGTDKRGTGPVPRKRSSQTIHRCYPTFTAKGHFGKGSSNKGRGFAWRYKSKMDGCLYDIAGIHIRVSPCYAAKLYDENNSTVDSKGSSEKTHNQDWQFNKFFAIYRDKFGNHTSIPLLPRGDNYNNDKTMDDPDKGQYVFRNSDKSVDDDDIGCTRVGTDSHWNRGDYIGKDRDLTLDLLIPSTAVVPFNSMFVGFEFSIWVGTYSGMSRDHTFQLSEFCPIPGAVAEKIRGKNPNQYSDGYFTVIPDVTTNVNMVGDRQQKWKKFVPKDYGKANIY